MNLNKDKLYIKIIALGTIYNFVAEKDFYLKLFSVPKFNFKI